MRVVRHVIAVARALSSLPAELRAMREELSTLRRELQAESRSSARASKTAASDGKDPLADVFRDIKVATRASEKASAEMRQVRGDLSRLQQDVSDRLLQNTLVVTRAARALESAPGQADAVRLSGRTVPVRVEPGEGAPHGGSRIPTDERAPDPDGREWMTLDRCPACQCSDRTVVNPWNKLLLLETVPDAAAIRYDYAVCHGCGLLFATRRPFGERYRFLLAHFGDVIEKQIKSPVLNPYPLSDDDRANLRRLAAPGAFVSDHLGLASGDYLPQLLKDRFENSVHTDVIGSLLSPRGARVVEVRSRVGTILDGLRRAWGAEVYAMPIWESQQFLLREVYGIETSPLIDFDHFAIPFEGTFDLVICNHLVTHAIRLDEFFTEVRRKLRPGGHIYVHNEPEDNEFLAGNQSMLATLNPLHLQTFDPPSLVRALSAQGFETVFLKHQKNRKLFCLARLAEPVPMPMTDAQRDRRIAAYRNAFDRAVLTLDPPLRARVAAEWPAIVEHAIATGAAEFDDRGQLRVVAQPAPDTTA
ncbi:MAG: class I SAM-dependent methyltransferase [Vicinamibacterales bacterium]